MRLFLILSLHIAALTWILLDFLLTWFQLLDNNYISLCLFPCLISCLTNLMYITEWKITETHQIINTKWWNNTNTHGSHFLLPMPNGRYVCLFCSYGFDPEPNFDSITTTLEMTQFPIFILKCYGTKFNINKH